jgi:hypothetical protein
MSASWINGLLEEAIWQIGDEAGRARSKPALARADFEISVVQGIHLTVEPDPAPHPRHVNVCGWPFEKDKRLALAQELCAKSMLRIRHTTN